MTCDGQWYSVDDVAKLLQFRSADVADALDFLVKYGFAETYLADERRFRIAAAHPSPMEVANMLQSVGSASAP